MSFKHYKNLIRFKILPHKYIRRSPSWVFLFPSDKEDIPIVDWKRNLWMALTAAALIFFHQIFRSQRFSTLAIDWNFMFPISSFSLFLLSFSLNIISFALQGLLWRLQDCTPIANLILQSSFPMIGIDDRTAFAFYYVGSQCLQIVFSTYSYRNSRTVYQL